MTSTSTTPTLPASTAPIEQNPAAVYLASLTTQDSRRTMRQALDVVAGLLTDCRETALTLDWSAVRFQHTAAIRAQLADHYSPATTNKILAALRGTLKAAWHLEQISAEDYQRSRNVGVVKGSMPAPTGTPPRR